MPCLLLVITLRFTCGEKKIWYNIKVSQNIMKMIVGPKFQLHRFPSRQVKRWAIIAYKHGI